MEKKANLLFCIIILLMMVTACTNDNNVDPISTPNIETSSNPIPTKEPTNEIIEVEPSPSDKLNQAEALQLQDYSTIIQLKLGEGFYLEDFIEISDHKFLIHSRNDEQHSKLAIINILNNQLEEIWSEPSTLVNRGSLQVHENGTLSWITYEINNENTPYKTYYLNTNHEISKFEGFADISPDNKLTVSQGNGWVGIHGKSVERGSIEQWTKGVHDAQPLWLPDSSGFIFLYDTGQQIGDGAGPSYKLAKYDITKKEIYIFPFDAGFWGRIEWLKPGVSLVANHGFDDGVAIKIVDLTTEKQFEVLHTIAGYDFTGYAINQVNHHLWVSKQGKFEIYSYDGKMVTTQPWPTDFDEFTQLNSADDYINNPYYSGGTNGERFAPYRFAFSPNGEQIVYYLGHYGHSTLNIVDGVKVIVSQSDSSQPTPVTSHYMMREQVKWSLNSKQIYTAFNLLNEGGVDTYRGYNSYIGVIKLE